MCLDGVAVSGQQAQLAVVALPAGHLDAAVVGQQAQLAVVALPAAHRDAAAVGQQAQLAEVALPAAHRDAAVVGQQAQLAVVALAVAAVLVRRPVLEGLREMLACPQSTLVEPESQPLPATTQGALRHKALTCDGFVRLAHPPSAVVDRAQAQLALQPMASVVMPEALTLMSLTPDAFAQLAQPTLAPLTGGLPLAPVEHEALTLMPLLMPDAFARLAHPALTPVMRGLPDAPVERCGMLLEVPLVAPLTLWAGTEAECVPQTRSTRPKRRTKLCGRTDFGPETHPVKWPPATTTFHIALAAAP